MFTGIVRDMGEVIRLEEVEDVLTLVVQTRLDVTSFATGCSIAVNGACLTLVRLDTGAFVFQAVRETLLKTNLQKLRVGDKVHLEPAIALNAPLDGHLVSGHIDGLGRVVSISLTAGQCDLRISCPAGTGRYLLEKGSICIDGVSLTLFNVKSDEASVTLIPETLNRTNLGRLKKGDTVNIEFDLIGKWIEKLMPANRPVVQ